MLTKIDISFSLSVPVIFVRVAVWITLAYRRLRYGYAFRRIKLTRGKFAIVDPDDFEWLSQYKWHYSLCGYAKRTIYKNDNKSKKQADVYMHKIVCPTYTAGKVADHINRNKLDNRKANLRPATRKQNAWNREFKKGKIKTRYKGINWREDIQKWRVRLTINGRRKTIGHYDDETEAAKSYDDAVKKYRGQFAVTNFPDEK